MIKYETLVNMLIEVAKRHPNINFVKYGVDSDCINDTDFNTPAFIISPAVTTQNPGSYMRYGFQLIYIDKLTQEEDCFIHIMEDSIMYITGYLSVIDLELKVLPNYTLDPILDGFDGGQVVGSQCLIEIEDILNIEKYLSPFYVNIS